MVVKDSATVISRLTGLDMRALLWPMAWGLATLFGGGIDAARGQTPTAAGQVQPWMARGFLPAPASHLVIEQPVLIAPQGGHGGSRVTHGAGTAAEFAPLPSGMQHGDRSDGRRSDHHPHLPILANNAGRPATIPDAQRTPLWKAPYSYGHFGAAPRRQWSLHHGHQQTYTQWSLR